MQQVEALHAASIAAVAVLAVAIALTLPHTGVLVPGRSLAGVRLGDTATTVARRWGPAHDVCGVCDERTWLFHYATDGTKGVAAVFHGDRVAALFTLGAPHGWRTADGLRLGEARERVKELYGTGLRETVCTGYTALTIRSPRAATSIYVTGDSVYGFALSLPTMPVCR